MPRKRGRSEAKEKMLATTRELLQRQGYHGTGLKQILAESGAPRGSLYFHFPGGKEELAARALREGSGDLFERYGISDPTAPPAVILGEAVATLIRQLEESDFQHGCPVATIALEAAPYSDAIQSACQDHYEGTVGFLQQLFEGRGQAPDAARRQSLFLLSALQGALLLSKSFRSTEPLREVGALLAGWLGAG